MRKQQRDLSKENFGPIQCINYRGCLVWRKDSGYNWGGRTYPSQEELDEAIDRALGYLAKGIDKSSTVVNTGTISCTKGK